MKIVKLYLANKMHYLCLVKGCNLIDWCWYMLKHYIKPKISGRNLQLRSFFCAWSSWSYNISIYMQSFRIFNITLTIFSVIILRKSVKSIDPEPSLSMSAIIFLISSFFGSNPRALMATCSTDNTSHTAVAIWKRLQKILNSTNLQLLHVYGSSSIGVKKVKSLLDFLLLLLRQVDSGAGLFLLAGRRSWFTVTRSLEKREHKDKFATWNKVLEVFSVVFFNV